MVTGFVVAVAVAAAAAAAAAVAVAAVAAAAVTVAPTAMLQPAAFVVANLQWKHCTGIKGVGGRPPLAADFTRGPSF